MLLLLALGVVEDDFFRVRGADDFFALFELVAAMEFFPQKRVITYGLDRH